MLIAALSLIVSTICATYVFVSANLKLTIFFVLLGLFLCFVVISICIKSKMLYIICAVVFFFMCPILNLFIKGKTLENYATSDANVVVFGRIAENYSYSSGGSVKILLDDVTLFDNNEEKSLSDKILIYTNEDGLNFKDIIVGRYITVSAKLDFNKMADSYDIYYLNNDIIATTYVFNSKILFTDDYNITLKDSIKNKVYDLLSSNDINHADIGYAMLFGDDTLIDPNTKAVFQNTGIAHLLAVSGLHVSIIILIINFILKKMKASPTLKTIILAVMLLFYCYLCDFSVSVIRASAMAIFALYAISRGKAYDNLSVLSLLASIILLISPLQLFNLSFILSFSAVLAIILLAKPLERVFGCVFYDKFSSTFALNVAVQVGLLFTNIYFFERYNALGIVCNLISVPIATIAFIILIASSLIGLIFPFMSFMLYGYEFLMDLVVKFNAFVTSLGTSVVLAGVSVIFLIMMFIVEFICSDYVFVKKTTKLKASLIVCAICNMLALVLW